MFVRKSFLASVSVAIGIGIGFLFGSKAGSPTTKDWWDIVTALGTMAAVIVAVVLWAKADHDSKKHKRARGMLQLVVLESPLISLLSDVKFMLEQLRKYDDNEHGDVPFVDTVVFASLKDPTLDALTPEALDSISAVSDEVALHLGFAASTLKAYRVGIADFAKRVDLWKGVEPHVRTGLVEKGLVVAAEAGLSFGYVAHAMPSILTANKKRALRAAHHLYTDKQMGPPISLSDLGIKD